MFFPKKNIELAGFDDRRFFWLGVLVATLIIPFIYKSQYIGWNWTFAGELFNVFLFSLSYFTFYRWLLLHFRKQLPRPEQFWERAMRVIAISIVATPAINLILGNILEQVRFYCNQPIKEAPSFATILIITYLLCIAVIAIYEAAYYLKKYMDSQIEKERLEAMHAEMRLHNLRNQINPHFLFNSLNILMSLIASDSKMAMNYLGKLSKFYRYTVGQNDIQKVSLEEELYNAKLFGELLQVRFENGLHFEWPKEDRAGYIIPLSLQLLIENAVKHNITSKDIPMSVEIYFENEHLCVRNPIQPKITPVESTGMGLKNIQERYNYFSDLDVIIVNNKGQFTVKLPILSA